MALTVEAIYEGGVLKLAQPLPLNEHEKVRITVEREQTWARKTAGNVPCRDAELIDQAALDPELEFGPWEEP